MKRWRLCWPNWMRIGPGPKSNEQPGTSPELRRSGGGRTPFIIGLVIVTLAVLFYFLLPAALPGQVPVEVRVTTGSSTRAIARQLAAQGVVRSAEHFLLWVRLLSADGRLQAGDYLLSPGMTPPAIVAVIRDGRVAGKGVTIPEGYTVAQIADLLERLKLAEREKFLAAAADPALVLGEDSPFEIPNPSLEGYLFPDTYRIAPGTPEVDILRLMVRRTAEKLLPLVTEIGLPEGLSLHGLLTLASIVEKEARIPEERPLIAGVFWRRLKMDMPLQADPSVKYVLSPAPVYLSHEDIQIDSPYNTYRYRGLPPGPIANPGLDAVKAVLEPKITDYLYFVAKGDGTHIFSATYEEHLAAKHQVQREAAAD